jgi:transposase
MVTPKRARRVFTAEFKLEAARLCTVRRRAGDTVAQIARDLAVRPDLLRTWVRATEGVTATVAPAAVFPGHGHSTPEKAELRRLTDENERLRQENEFLKKAAAYFATTSR